LPLSEKARIEVYLPDLPHPTYRKLLEALEEEFTYTFGGCTISRGLDGSYLSSAGLIIQDRVNLIYTDIHLSFTSNADSLSAYAEKVRQAAYVALEEEAILIAVLPVFHIA
jgi:hypothetical protein